MATQPTLTSSVIRFCAGVIASLVCLIPFAPAATAQTIWTVTIDVTNSNNKNPTYDPEPDPAGASNCTSPAQAQPSDGTVYICQGDSVVWSVRTTHGHGGTVIEDPTGILKYMGSSLYWLNAAAGSKTDAGVTDANAAPGQYPYHVIVFDPDDMSKPIWIHDPQIVIGTGHGPDTLSKLTTNIKEEAKGLRVSRTLNADATEKARLQAEQALADLRKLKELLESK